MRSGTYPTLELTISNGGDKNDPDRFKNLIPVEIFRIRPKILAANRVAVKFVKINL